MVFNIFGFRNSWAVKKGELYWPSEKMKKKALVNDKKIYEEANKDPVRFWEGLAEKLFWFKKWDKAFEHRPPYFKWFLGGKINITSNIFEKRVDWEKIKNKPALIWEPELVEEKPRILTYEELFKQVNKTANALKKLGVKKGDIVGIYLPMIPEAIISMLACARIGAVHTVVFSAFSPEALRVRLQMTQAKLLITADGYYRRGKIINLKESADEGVKGTSVEKVIVVKRIGNQIGWNPGQDFWWHELVEKESEECEAEVMDSEDLLFILYTSGCCHQDTLIQLENGEIKKISELVEKGGSNLVNINLNDLKQDSDKITDRYKYYWPLQLLKIQTPLSSIEVTPNHPFFVLTPDGEILEKEAKNLKIGEYILQITNIKIKGKKQKLPHPKIQYHQEKCNRINLSNKPRIPRFLTPGLSQILGYITGDGHVTNQKVEVTDKDKNNLLFYKSLIEKELGVRCYIKKYSRQRLTINSVFLAKYLNTVFPEISVDSHLRKIPILVQKTPDKTLAAFIRGLFDAEGSVVGRGIKIVSRSQDLIRTLQMIFLRFGIIANYFEEKRETYFKSKNKKYRILVYELRITDRESIKNFERKIGFSSEKKRKKLRDLIKKLNSKRVASMIHQFPMNELARKISEAIELPKKESHYETFLTSYIYGNRRIKRVRISEISKYLRKKIDLMKKLNFKGKLTPEKKKEIKFAISLFKIPRKKIAQITGKSYETVHQYLDRKNNIVSESSINEFYKSFLPYLSETKKRKLKELKEILKKLERLENLEDVSFFEIKKISKVKNDSNLVYDLTTFKNHNYIANGFVVHNSTGKPKGCMHTCGGYTVQAYWTGKWIFDFHEDDLFWCTSDLGWITGHTYVCYSPLLNGITTLIFEGSLDYPIPQRWAQIIEKYNVTIFYTAPTAIRMFEKMDGEAVRKYKLKSLRLLGSVGEVMDEGAWYWYFENVGKGKCLIVDTWWQTETGGILITSLPGIGPFKPGYVGLPFPGIKFDILDEEGKPCQTNQHGNLVILPPFSPGMLRGIYKDPEKYENTYFSKYGKEIYLAGDGALRDENGLIKITGRIDDVLKVAGHRLSNAEIEEAINLHEAVVESAVVGLPDPVKGEVPIVFVILRPGFQLTDKLSSELVELVSKKIGPIAKPARIVCVQDLPKTRSGKIMRRIIKNLIKKEEVGDISTLANPECVSKLKEIIATI